MALKDYPKWVLEHRAKGREIRYINGKYYLYLYHNEVVEGVRKKITDEYLGRITIDGLIPPAKKNISYTVLLYGLTAFIFSSCSSIISSITKRYPSRHSKLLSLAILKHFFDNNLSEYSLHYISIIFPKPILKDEKDSISLEISRIINMMDHFTKKALKDLTLSKFKVLILPIYIVGEKNKWTLANIDDETKKIINKYNINLEINYGKDK
ncbi:MAG: hypothetical protein WC006_09295 [Bacilli bacterium]|nr:hypothetical protein [Bacilli bacterium]